MKYNLVESLTKWQMKLIFVVGAFIIFLMIVFYSLSIVDELVLREQNLLKFYADVINIVNNRFTKQDVSSPMDSSAEDLLTILENLTRTISFPVIKTDEYGVPNEPFNLNVLNVNIDSTLSNDQQRQYLQKMVYKMGDSYKPIVSRNKNGKVLTMFYYTNSALIDKLKLFPFIVIFIIIIFVVVGYVAFSNIRKNEESKVWVGMAKEAAHQLGTPLSSMLAWIEILKSSDGSQELIVETVTEMEKDVDRLNVIARRFSKIGSQPEKQIYNISEQIETVCAYFEKRLPHLGRKIDIIRNIKEPIKAEVNLELFEWVIENLLKNAAEAIETENGSVEIKIIYHSKRRIVISVKDSGKGMTAKQKRQIFFPGFTTKKRGWGLGLTLCKRIIEDYHKGKIYVKDTAIGKGTDFHIELPLRQSYS